MARTSPHRRSSTLLAASLLVACGGGANPQPPPATPQTVQEHAGDAATSLAPSYLAALAALQASNGTAAVGEALAPVQEALGAIMGVPLAVPDGLSLPTFPAAELAGYLRERVFTAGNVESSDRSSVTYRLPSAAVCPYDLPDGSHALAPSAGALLSPLCVALVDGVGLRIRATEPAAGEVDFAFLLGDSRASPLSVRLTADALVAEVSLAAAGELLRQLLGSDSGVELSLSGTVALRLEVLRRSGPASEVAASIAFPAPLSFRLASQGEEATFATEARSPAFRVRVDGIGGGAEVTADLGVTSLAMPYDDGSGDPTGLQEVVTLGGLTFTTPLAAVGGEVPVSGFGLGAERSQVTIGGERYLSLDLSPRKVDLGFRRDATPGRSILSVDADARLSVYADTRLVGGVDPSFAGKAYDFVARADSGRPELMPYVAGGTVALRVVRGSFALEDGTRSLQVPAGQCLLRSPPAVTVSWVDDYQAGTCP